MYYVCIKWDKHVIALPRTALVVVFQLVAGGGIQEKYILT